MSKFTLFDLDLPSEIPQHSELNGCLSLFNTSINRTRGNIFPSQTNQSYVFSSAGPWSKRAIALLMLRRL